MPRLNDGYIQTILVGFICFSGPGMFNALTGLGAAGGEDPLVANLSNALLYASLFIFGFLASALFNIFGNKALFCFGGLSYAFYVLAQFLAGRYPVLTPLAILSGGLVGIGAACLWTAQGASVLAYAPENQDAKYISTFWLIFSLGGFIGGLLLFFGNFNAVSENTGKANAISYYILVGAMLIGPFISVALLVPTRLVVKRGGSIVPITATKTTRQELISVFSQIFDRNMHFMAPYFFMSNMWYAYFFNGINDSLFTIRTRCFNSALFWLIQMGGTKIALRLLHGSIHNRKRNGQRFYILLAIYANIIFILAGILQYIFEGGWDKDIPITAKIDMTEFRRFIFPCFILLCFGFLDSLVQTYGMWLNSGLADGHPEKMAQYSGFSKSVQSLGSAASWLVDGTGYTYRTQYLFCWILFGLALPTTYLATTRIPTFSSDNIDEKMLLQSNITYSTEPVPMINVHDDYST